MKRTTKSQRVTLRLSRDEADYLASESKALARWPGERLESAILRAALARHRIEMHKTSVSKRQSALKF